MADFDARVPTAARRWYKAHGLGNDYLVVAEGHDWSLTPEAVAELCHRTLGVGSDGIVVLLGGPGATSPFRLRMFNPDGSEFERSGNGLRVLASYLCREGRVVSGGDAFGVEVGGDRVRMQVHALGPSGVYDVSVEMGRAALDPRAVGLGSGWLDREGRLQVPDVGPVRLQTVSVGNPHAVVFTDELTTELLHRLGPRLATHRAFARGTNVQLARLAGERDLEILIWERGVGPTSASGTSSCAAAVAAVRGGLLPAGEIRVHMDGGTLLVTVTEELDIVLRGPVQEVSVGELTEGFLQWLQSLGSPA